MKHIPEKEKPLSFYSEDQTEQNMLFGAVSDIYICPKKNNYNF